MRGRKALLVVLFAVVLGAFLSWTLLRERQGSSVYEPPSKKIAVASPCPWRGAESDLTNWFPGATAYAIRDIPLSGQRLQLQERLGRTLQPEEMALHLYVVSSNKVHLGTVLTRRIKGPHGTIEIALALKPSGEIHQFKIQRMREPKEVAESLERIDLEGRFQGHTLATFSEREIIPETSSEYAKEIAVVVKALLVLYHAAQIDFHLHH
jgi:hypothetical protein